MNKLNKAKRVQIVSGLVEGLGINAVARITGVSNHTVLKLLEDLGTACAKYQDKTLRNLPCKRLQCDEVWSFCYAKEKNVPQELKGQFGFGDVWTFTAICADTKLIPSWLVGKRDGGYAFEFMTDLAGRLANKVQLTTDGHKMYLDAVEDTFGCEIDYGMLVKAYSNPRGEGNEKRYSPGECCGTIKTKIMGNPDMDHVSTSYVERHNLTICMGQRRFTRLTNAHSKKIQNHIHSLALFIMYYNFVRIHQTLRCSPAMEAKVTDHLWSLEELVGLIR